LEESYYKQYTSEKLWAYPTYLEVEVTIIC
jgi:hypothetical protein